MYYRLSLICVCLCTIVLSGCTPGTSTMLSDTIDSRYKVGQVWRYQTRTDEADSTFSIVKVEHDAKLGIIVHISLRGLHIKNPHHPNGFTDTASHMPFAEDAITKSVTTLVQENAPLPDFQAGYNQWRQAADAGKAGIFTITVAESLDVMEQALNK